MRRERNPVPLDSLREPRDEFKRNPNRNAERNKCGNCRCEYQPVSCGVRGIKRRQHGDSQKTYRTEEALPHFVFPCRRGLWSCEKIVIVQWSIVICHFPMRSARHL